MESSAMSDDIRTAIEEDHIGLSLSDRVVRCRRFIVLMVSVSCLASLMLGYDISILGSARIFIREHFQWTDADNWKDELVVASLNGAAVFGGLLSGFMADRFGRRPTIAAAAIVFTSGSLLMALAPWWPVLVLGRVVMGLGVGTGLVVAPLYVAELAPARVRGFMVAWTEIIINTGLLLGYLLGFAFSFVSDLNVNWRLMLGFGALPGVFLGLGLLFLPESPAYLVAHERFLDAALALDRTSSTVDETLARLKDTVDARARQEGSDHQPLLTKIRESSLQVKRLLVIGIVVGIAQQITGIEAALYYSITTFQSMGLNSTSQLLGANIGIGGTKLSTTVVGALLLDRVGRRPLLITSSIGILCGLLAVSAGMLTDALWVVVTGQMVFVAFFGVGWGPCTWVLVSELFPLMIRGRTIGIATTGNRLVSFAIALSFLSLGDAITPMGEHFLFAGFAALVLVFVVLFVPETRGVALDDISSSSSEGGGGVSLPYQSCTSTDNSRKALLSATASSNVEDTAEVVDFQ